jgi:hypothetical protein
MGAVDAAAGLPRGANTSTTKFVVIDQPLTREEQAEFRALPTAVAAASA